MDKKEVEEIKKDVIELFNSEDNDYDYSDRLNVALHEILGDYVSIIDQDDLLDHLKEYDDSDFKTLDSGMYDGVLEAKGFIHLMRVLLYCLIEQDLYNDDEFNELQNIIEINGKKLK